MTEKLGGSIEEEESEEQLTPEQLEEQRLGEEMFADYEVNLADLPEKPKIPLLEEYKDALEGMLLDFEKEFPLEDLHAITTKEETINNPLRQGAKAAHIKICQLFKKMSQETAMSAEEFEEYKRRKDIIGNAIGIINNGMVDHDR